MIADQDKRRTNTRKDPHSENIGPIVLIGPPGSGKGTQSRAVAEHFRIPPVSTGALFREQVLLATPIGAKVGALIAKGELVPDDLVCDVVAARLRESDARRGFVLDGFPRTPAQAVWLDLFLDFEFGGVESRLRLPLVLHIQVDRGRLLQRVTGRRSCPRCGRIYNVHFEPPLENGICNVEGSRLVTREDDREEVMLERLSVYEQQTKRVADYYRKLGRVVILDGDRPASEVRSRILEAVDQHIDTKNGFRSIGTQMECTERE